MDEDQNLALDESQRMAQHEAVKGAVRQEAEREQETFPVAEIARQAGRLDAQDRARAAAAGEQLKQQALTEVAATEAELGRARAVARVSQAVDYLFYLIYGLLSLEILLELLGGARGQPLQRIH
jgi:hypothetical protein